MNDNIKVITNKTTIDNIADSVRERTGFIKQMPIDEIAHNILIIAGEGQGILTRDATIESGAQMLDGVTAYGAGGKVTGTIPIQSGSNIIPNDETQIAIPAGTYAEGDIVVDPVPTETKDITVNGTYTPTDGKYFSSVNVNISGGTGTGDGNFETQSKTVTPTEKQQIVTPDGGYDGLNSVTVEAISSKYVGSGVARKSATTITPTNSNQTVVTSETYVEGDIVVSAVPTETKDITVNGTYTPEEGKYFSSVSVNIPEETFETQSKTVTPTESKQTISPDTGYDGLSNVTVEAVPADYVGSGVTRQTAKSITPTKSTQTVVDAGVYTEGDIVVNAIPEEYITTADATATPNDMAKGVTAYVNGEKIEGTLLDISNNAWEKTTSVFKAVSATVDRYENWLGQQSHGLVLTSEYIDNNKIIRPGAEISIGYDDIGSATVDKVLLGETFTSSKGVKLIGTHVCSSIDTSDATATAADISNGKTAYVNGVKITGTHECTSDGATQTYYVSNVEPSSSLGNDGDLCLVRAGE